MPLFLKISKLPAKHRSTTLCCLILYIALLLTQLIIIARPVKAGIFANDYPDLDAVDCQKKYGIYSWCKNNHFRSSRGYDYRNCTDGAAYWTMKYTGVDIRGWGNASTWNEGASRQGRIVKPGHAGNIEPGDIAQSNDTDWGHVGFVIHVNKNSSGFVTSIDIAELNRGGTGEFGTYPSGPRNSGGKFNFGSNDWDHFIDVNGPNKGLNNEDLGGTKPKTQQPPDSDKDGVEDSKDFCPQLPGSNLNGCPEFDMNADINGDGRDDLVHMWNGGVNTLQSNGDGSYHLAREGYKPYAAYNMTGGQWLSGKFNWDQRTDLIHIWSGGVNTWLSNGDGTYSVIEGAKPFSSYSMTGGFKWQVADVNADGKDELLHLWSGGINTWFSNNNGTYSATPTYSPWPGYNMQGAGNWYFGDLNGDGKSDLYHIWHGGVNTMLANGDGAYTFLREGYRPLPGYNMGGGFYWKIIDVTGDNKSDILYFWSGGVDTWISHGDGTFAFPGTYRPRADYTMTSGSWYFGDVNSDARNDVLHLWSGGVNTWISNDSGSYNLVSEGATPLPGYGMTGGFRWQANDVNGDGRDELLHFWSGGINTWFSNDSGSYSMPATYRSRPNYGMLGGAWY